MRCCRRCGAPVDDVVPPVVMPSVRSHDGLNPRRVTHHDRDALLVDGVWHIPLAYECTRTELTPRHPRECGYLSESQTVERTRP